MSFEKTLKSEKDLNILTGCSFWFRKRAHTILRIFWTAMYYDIILNNSNDPYPKGWQN